MQPPTQQSPSQTQHKPIPQGKLTLPDVLKLLVIDDIVDKDSAEQLFQDRRFDSSQLHPFVVIHDRPLTNAATGEAITVEFLCQWIAEYAGIPYVEIDPLKLELQHSIGDISQEYAERLKILPTAIKDGVATIATTEPFCRDWLPDLSRLLKADIKLVLISPLAYSRLLPEVYRLASAMRGAEQATAGKTAGGQNFEQLIDIDKDQSLDAEAQHVVNLVDWLFKYAFEQRASDIHIEPRRDAGNLRFRIDGVLHQVYQLPKNILQAMTSRLKLLGRMDMVEKRRPQDGRIKTRTNQNEEIECRLSTMPTAFGEKLVIRIFSPETSKQSFNALGFDSAQLAIWQKWTNAKHGLILVTGPTGSGKTTTLYATLKQLAKPEVNICTIEDPIEMVEPSFNQMQVQPQIDLSFADGIRTLLRQDPDMMMVGEIRDNDTAQMSIQAALTGHLVFSSLHTNDSCSAITRLLDLGVPHYLLQSTLLGVVAQRLARKLCPSCKTPHEVSAQEWASLSNGTQIPAPKHLYQATGCKSCRQTGYKGRIGLYELLPVNDEIKPLLTANTELKTLQTQAKKLGLITLYQQGLQKVAAGQISLESLQEVITPDLSK